MTHYEERLDRDLATIRGKLADLASSVQTALRDGTQALFSKDDELAYKVVLNDLPINRASRELDRICHRFFAVHLPSVGVLRFVSAAMRTNLELERIGDYAVTICRESVQITHPPKGTVGKQMEELAGEAQSTLRQAVAAFTGSDVEQARLDAGRIYEVRRRFDRVINGLANEEGALPVQELLYYLVILGMLRRVVDQAKNICEEAVFAMTGQTKAPKSYRILFLDEANSTLGPMAQAIARKGFPESGQYDTAGKQAVDGLDAGFMQFMSEHGTDLGDVSPRALDPATDLADYHVIVSLQGPVKSYIDAVPFSTVALEWDVGDLPAGLAPEETQAQLETLYRTLATRVRDLMMTMQGEEAR